MTRQDELNEAWCNYRGKCSTEIMQALAFALRWCDQHPHWISVEDELPPRKKAFNYLSINVLATDGNEIYKSFYDYSIGGWFDDNLFRLDNITHWMPLPATPMEIRGNQRKISPNQQQIIGTTDHIKIAMDVIDKKGGEE